MDEVECVVVGAGVVGLAVARALALRGREVIVLEAADGIGTETSSRNSEVIHAGIYYPGSSLMARFCVAGRERVYAYCRAWRAAPQLRQADRRHQRRGGRARRYQARAAANGVEHARAHRRRSPCDGAHCTAPARCCRPPPASSTATPIMLALQGDAEDAGACVFLSPVTAAA